MEEKKKDPNQLCLIYEKDTGFLNSFNTLEVVEKQIKENDKLAYVFISDDIHKRLFNSYTLSPKVPLVNIESLGANADDDLIIDLENEETFLYQCTEEEVTEPEFNIEEYKYGLISNLKSVCGSFIYNGLQVDISDKGVKHFTYKLEDQVNLKSLIDNATGDIVYYRASGENYESFTLEEIQYVYQELENYKNYNLIYCGVLCQWVSENYTLENYTNKDVIEYGYTNDWILEKVGEIYGSELL